MTRKNESITLAICDADSKALEEIAAAHGCTYGSKANVSELFRRIAQGKLRVIAATEDYELCQLLDRREVQRAIELIKNLKD
jgi:hypothetical protein